MDFLLIKKGLASESAEEETSIESEQNIEANEDINKMTKNLISNEENLSINKKAKFFEEAFEKNIKNNELSRFNFLLSEQTDSNRTEHSLLQNNLLNERHLEFVAENARAYWKQIARHVGLEESQIVELENCRNFPSLSEKLLFVLKLWLRQQNNQNCDTLGNLVAVLAACRLNKIKG